MQTSRKESSNRRHDVLSARKIVQRKETLRYAPASVISLSASYIFWSRSQLLQRPLMLEVERYEDWSDAGTVEMPTNTYTIHVYILVYKLHRQPTIKSRKVQLPTQNIFLTNHWSNVRVKHYYWHHWANVIGINYAMRKWFWGFLKQLEYKINGATMAGVNLVFI